MRLRNVIASSAFFVAAIVAGCDLSQPSWKTPSMTIRSSRIYQLFQDSRTVCFGRFLIDIPNKAEVIWGTTGIPLRAIIHKKQAAAIDRIVDDRIAFLEKEDRYPTEENQNLYFETVKGTVPGMKHIVSQEDFSSTGRLRIESFFVLGPNLVVMQALSTDKTKVTVLTEINEAAQRLRLREQAEIPPRPAPASSMAS